jgi:predicted phosphoribosyltransferase
VRPLFTDRADAGRHLAARLADYRGRDDVVVLALPRGGVPVAAAVARDLGVPLDVFVVRKVGVPGHEELAMGAVATGGVEVRNDDVIRLTRTTEAMWERAAARERAEVDRRTGAYRGDRPPPDVAGRTVLLVDDGVATGASVRAAAIAVRRLGPARLVIAVPVAPPDTVEALRAVADDVIYAAAPASFHAVGAAYLDFSQTTDAEVRRLLGDDDA